MPILHNKKLLFIHIPKNAGRSIEAYFNFNKHAPSLKSQWRSPLNGFAKALLNLTRDRNSKLTLYGVIDIGLTAQHLTYQEIELFRFLPPTELRQYFSFAIVRNPWDRAVSIYRHMRRDKTEPESIESFSSFLQDFFTTPHIRHNDLSFRRQQYEFVRNCDGSLSLSKIIRFENLSNEIPTIASRFNITGSIPWIGKQHSSLHYRQLYSDESRTLIERIYAKDIEIFNYRF